MWKKKFYKDIALIMKSFEQVNQRSGIMPNLCAQAFSDSCQAALSNNSSNAALAAVASFTHKHCTVKTSHLSSVQPTRGTARNRVTEAHRRDEGALSNDAFKVSKHQLLRRQGHRARPAGRCASGGRLQRSHTDPHRRRGRRSPGRAAG